MTANELDLLFPTTPRWGWELRLPAPARPSPERDHPPVPPPGRRLSADGARKVLVIASVSVVVGFAGYAADLALEASMGAKHVDPQELIVGAICSPLTIWAMAVWRRARVDTVRNKSAVTFLSLLLFFTCILTSLVLAGEGLVLLVCAVIARRRGAAAEERWREWQRRVVEFETSEQRRVDSVDLWYPVSPSPAADLVGVFGGTAVGWMVLLATFGSSLISRGPLVVVDLTRRRSTRLLVDLANLRGISPRTIAAPSGMAVADMFAGWTWEALTSLVVEALHANEADPAMSRRERQEDRGVLRDVAACFDRAGPVSFARLLAGLQVVNKERRAPSSEATITMDEFEKLSDLYGEVQRSHGGVLERATRLERVIRDLDVIDGNKASSRTGVSPNADLSPDGMTVFRVDEQIEELDSEFLVDVLFQLLLRQVRVGQSQTGDVGRARS